LQPGKPPPINARAESLSSSAMFREAQRCLIPATGFYEWRSGQPMHIHLRSGEAFAFAGVWLPPAHHGDQPTAAIVTTRANELMAEIPAGRPASVRPGEEERWRDPAWDGGELGRHGVDASAMEAYAVGRQVNSWENEGPELIAPAPDGTSKEEAQQLGLPL